MSNDDFKKIGIQAIEWADRYLREGYEGSVAPNTKPGEISKKLAPATPSSGEPLEAIFEDFERDILPGILHWNDPRFFGYFPCNNSGPSVLAELLASTLGINAMSWATSPAATELELKVVSWLGKMIDLEWPGVLQDSASSGSFAALLAARERKAKINENGYYGQKPLTAYMSAEAHSSIKKATRMAGYGDKWCRVIPTLDDFQMDLIALRNAIEKDLSSDLVPTCVVATVGTTSTTAIDDVKSLADICKEHGIWLHVDAALAGSAAILPEMKWLMNGVSEADSFLFNPHKWLFTNFDCSAFFCRHPLAIKEALSLNPEYLKSDYDDVAENLRDWSIPLGRGFRSLKLWFVLRAYGVEGLQARIREHLSMTQWFASQIQRSSTLTLLTKPKLNTVCFYAADDSRTQLILDKINESGKAYLTHTRANDRLIIRVAFGQTQSKQKDAERLWDLLKQIDGEI